MSIRYSIRPTTVAVTVLLLASASGAFGQQSNAQQKCVVTLNKDGAAVAKAQGKEIVDCLTKAGQGKLTVTAQACLTADAKAKVQKGKDKTSADNTKLCGTPPTFGYTGATTINSAAVQRELDVAAAIFGANLDVAVLSCTTSKTGCACQQTAMKDVETLAETKLAEFIACKTSALKTATSASGLVACVSDASAAGSIAADTKGKIKKKVDKLRADIGKKCDTPGVTGAFPGSCTSLAGSALGDCLDGVVECRVCQMINEMDGLSVDCDLFDDQTANQSCSSPPPSQGFQGTLLATTGRFTYSAVIGIPGADAECNSNFAGSHSCTFAELQTAAAAGKLVGAKDVGGNTVASFWAIDSTHADTAQCHQTIAWDYQTAHTGHFAEVTTLDNAAGTLGPASFGICASQSWVGCCK